MVVMVVVMVFMLVVLCKPTSTVKPADPLDWRTL